MYSQNLAAIPSTPTLRKTAIVIATPTIKSAARNFFTTSDTCIRLSFLEYMREGRPFELDDFSILLENVGVEEPCESYAYAEKKYCYDDSHLP